MDETLTIRPQRAESMSSSARRVQWKAPDRLVSTTLPQSSALMRIARPSRRWPALLTSTWTGPKRSRASAKARSTASGSDTSAWRSAPFRLSVATFHPRSRSASATAAPMPRVPPVTTAQPSSRADMDALLPRHDARAPHEPGAKGGEADAVAGAQRAVAFGLPQRQGDRGRRCVREVIDVEGDALARQAELIGRRLDDPRVGLMGDEQIEIGRVQPAPVQRGLGCLDHPANGVAVDLSALHPDQPLIRVGVEQVAMDAVAAELEGRATELQLPTGDDQGGGAVAEEDR